MALGPSAPTAANFSTLPTDGIDFTQVYTINTSSSGGANYAPEFPAPPFAIGQRVIGSNDSEYVFCQVNTGSIAQWSAVAIDNLFQVSTLTMALASKKYQFGIAPVAATFTNTTTIATYMWIAVKGSNLAVLTRAASTAFARTMYVSTTSPGRLTTQSLTSGIVTGIVLTQSASPAFTANSSMATQLFATWPRMSVGASGNTALVGYE
jgi:hypothetical protein